MSSAIGPTAGAYEPTAGSVGGAAGNTPVRPIGISPALTRLPGEDWWRGNQWPPGDWGGAWPNTQTTRFPRRAWAPHYYSIAVLGEFVQAELTTPALRWDSISLPAVPIGPDLKAEFDELAALIEYRPGVLSEAMAQCHNMLDYWRGILPFNQASHPWTFDLAQIALRVAEFQAMHYKRLFHRPRPSQLSTVLMPPLDPPPHASYPSASSTESHLLSLCLAQVMPSAAKAPLQRLAGRVARNREVLGLHYPSDAAAGKLLAEQSFLLLMTCPTVVEVRTHAINEWTPRN